MSTQLFTRRTTSTRLLLVAWLLSQSAWAQSADPTARAAARDLGNEGVKAFQANNFSVATERLTRAYQILRVPSLGLWLGRSLAKQGRLVEASELYLEVTRLSFQGGDAAVQEQAQKDAASERTRLLPQLGKLVIRLTGQATGQSPGAPSISLDGRELSAALLGVPTPIDPGKHVIVARQASGDSERREIAIAEGQTAEVAFEVKASDIAAAPTAASTVTTSAAVKTAEPTSPSEPPKTEEPRPVVPVPANTTSPSPSEPKRLVPNWVGYTALAVGGAGVAVGTFFGLNAKTKLTALRNKDDACEGNRCSPDYADDVRKYNWYCDLSTAGFVVGGVGLASGAVILWLLPSSKGQEKPVAIDTVVTGDLKQLTLRGTF